MAISKSLLLLKSTIVDIILAAMAMECVIGDKAIGCAIGDRSIVDNGDQFSMVLVRIVSTVDNSEVCKSF